jgi:hypothetical protein
MTAQNPGDTPSNAAAPEAGDAPSNVTADAGAGNAQDKKNAESAHLE